jgi:hypothetical protein
MHRVFGGIVIGIIELGCDPHAGGYGEKDP